MLSAAAAAAPRSPPSATLSMSRAVRQREDGVDDLHGVVARADAVDEAPVDLQVSMGTGAGSFERAVTVPQSSRSMRTPIARKLGHGCATLGCLSIRSDSVTSSRSERGDSPGLSQPLRRPRHKPAGLNCRELRLTPISSCAGRAALATASSLPAASRSTKRRSRRSIPSLPRAG